MQQWIIWYVFADFAHAIEFQFNCGLVAPTEYYSSTLTEIVLKNKANYLHLDKLNKEHFLTPTFAFLFDNFRHYA